MSPPSNSGKFLEQEGMVAKNSEVNGKENAKEDDGGMRTKINGKWIWLSAEFVKSHPGGPVLTQYRSKNWQILGGRINRIFWSNPVRLKKPHQYLTNFDDFNIKLMSKL